MARVLYTAEATVTGGRADGHGRTNDGALDVQLRSPREMGGEGGGTNPEQLFAVGYAACFESALGVVGRRERAEVGNVSIDSRVSLLPTEERGFKLAMELDVTLPQVQDPEQAARIVAAAHQVCPVLQCHPGQHRRDTDRERPGHQLTRSPVAVISPPPAPAAVPQGGLPGKLMP